MTTLSGFNIFDPDHSCLYGNDFPVVDLTVEMCSGRRAGGRRYHGPRQEVYDGRGNKLIVRPMCVCTKVLIDM